MASNLMNPAGAPRPRSTPRRPRKWRYPAGQEADYAAALDQIARRTTEAVTAHVLPALGAAQRADDLNSIPETEGWYETLRQAFLAALSAASVDDEAVGSLVALVARRVERFNAEQFHRTIRQAYGVDIFKAEPRLGQLATVWEAENIKLIKSIPAQYLEGLHGKVVAAVQKGTSLRELTALVRQTYKMPRNRAELIARDQVGKLNGQLTEYRQQNIGVEEYRWRGVLDEREREEHVAREGEVFRWDKPPEDGHPGQPIRCRCWAEAVLPLFEDLDALVVH